VSSVIVGMGGGPVEHSCWALIVLNQKPVKIGASQGKPIAPNARSMKPGVT
jgi:hypothetical protein